MTVIKALLPVFMLLAGCGTLLAIFMRLTRLRDHRKMRCELMELRCRIREIKTIAEQYKDIDNTAALIADRLNAYDTRGRNCQSETLS